jgi:hypothetical protein
LPPSDKSENDQDSDSDWFTYCIEIWILTFNIWVSHALEMTIHFYNPTLELFCFSFTQPSSHSKFCLHNPFLFGACTTGIINWYFSCSWLPEPIPIFQHELLLWIYYMSKFLNTSEFIIMINSRHNLNLSMELIINWHKR